MIQFNLLPDIKLEYIKAKRTKRTVIVIAALISAVSFGIMLLLFLVVNVFQKTHLNNLNNDISTIGQELQETEDLTEVLTVQNQISRLNELQASKPVSSRVLDFVAQVTPAVVTIADLNIDFSSNLMTFEGEAANLKDINQFADTLKFTKFKLSDGTESEAFSSVVLRTFGRSEDGATYSIELSFNPLIFDSSNEVKLIVPNTTTTRSVTEKPGPLFEPLSEDQQEAGE